MFRSFFFQAEDGIRDLTVTGVQTCALPISPLGNLWYAARAWTALRSMRKSFLQRAAALDAWVRLLLSTTSTVPKSRNGSEIAPGHREEFRGGTYFRSE